MNADVGFSDSKWNWEDEIWIRLPHGDSGYSDSIKIVYANATQQKVIDGVIAYLSRNLYHRDEIGALNEVASIFAGEDIEDTELRVYWMWNNLTLSFLRDLRNSSSATDFLNNYCDIDHELNVSTADIASINIYNSYPLYFREGMNALANGIDDRLKTQMQNLVSNYHDVSRILRSGGTASNGDNAKAVGYMLLHYLAKQCEGKNVLNESAQAMLDGGFLNEMFTYQDQIGVSMNFNLDNVNGVNDLNGESFTVVCGDCKQCITITFDAESTLDDSTYNKNDSYNSEYIIGIKNLTDISNDSLSEIISDGIMKANHKAGIYEKIELYYEDEDGTNMDTVNILMDSNHNISVAWNPRRFNSSNTANGSKYIFLKDYDAPMQFVSGKIVDSEETVTTTNTIVNTIIEPVTIETDTEVVDYATVTLNLSNPFVIHHGTKSNQSISIFMSDMHTKSLGLDGVSISTRESANSALSVIDSAIDYALNESTNIGAYINRLEYTLANITSMTENIQAAESVIRDADMAKMIVEYTKTNILMQAAQSMLAQSNQDSSMVLNLLQ